MVFCRGESKREKMLLLENLIAIVFSKILPWHAGEGGK